MLPPNLLSLGFSILENNFILHTGPLRFSLSLSPTLNRILNSGPPHLWHFRPPCPAQSRLSLSLHEPLHQLPDHSSCSKWHSPPSSSPPSMRPRRISPSADMLSHLLLSPWQYLSTDPSVNPKVIQRLFSWLTGPGSPSGSFSAILSLTHQASVPQNSLFPNIHLDVPCRPEGLPAD